MIVPVVLQRYLLQLLLVKCSLSVAPVGLEPDSQHLIFAPVYGFCSSFIFG